MLIVAAIMCIAALGMIVEENVRGYFWLALGALVLYQGLRRVEIRERGISYPSTGILRWNRIESYQWEDDTLTVKVRRRPPFFPDVSWRVSPEHKEALEKILTHRVAGEQKREV